MKNYKTQIFFCGFKRNLYFSFFTFHFFHLPWQHYDIVY